MSNENAGSYVDLLEEEAPVITTGELQELVTQDLAEEPFPDDEIPRNSYIGGSEAFDACLGDRFGLWEIKVGKAKPPDLSKSDPVIFGRLFEAIVASEYARRYGKKVRRSRKVILHPKYPFMGVHLDRIIEGERGVLECKTGGLAKMEEWGEIDSEDVPPRYFFQGQHAMACTDRDYCDYPVLFGGQFFRRYRVARDETFIVHMIELEAEFWEFKEKSIPPDLGSPDEARRLWPTSKAVEVQASKDDVAAYEQLKELRKTLDVLEKQKGLLELALMTAIGDRGDTLMAGKDKLCSWKTQAAPGTNGWRFEEKRFKEEQPAIYAKYLKEAKARVFRLNLK